MASALVSAIIPVLNPDPAYFWPALDSLRRSRLADCILLVDDHSTRGQEHLQAAAEQGCQVVMSRGRGNASAARATGIHACRTDYVLNMDADDRLFCQTPARARGSLAPINLCRRNIPEPLPLDIWDLLDQPCGCQWGSIVRTDIARSVAITSINRQEDLAWAHRLLLSAWKHATPVATLPDTYYMWRDEQAATGLRDTMTGRFGRDPGERAQCIEIGYQQALDWVGVPADERVFLDLWRHRRTSQDPAVRSLERGAPVDVHILAYSGRMAWLRQAIDSLMPQPCNIHVVFGGFEDSIGAARAWAFRLGSAPFVSFIDDDDRTLPGTLDACLDSLRSHPAVCGVYTDRYHEHAQGHWSEERLAPYHPRALYKNLSEITHFKLMRRALVEQHLEELAEWPTWEEFVLCALLAQHGPWEHLPIFGAVKRARSAHQSSQRLSSPALISRARARARKALFPGAS